MTNSARTVCPPGPFTGAASGGTCKAVRAGRPTLCAIASRTETLLAKWGRSFHNAISEAPGPPTLTAAWRNAPERYGCV
ncbi:MAG: hypothetical protein IPI57_07260 [Candidatus Competibacteraceae bacterium]|nr:hypothetical protein [Candidatus Competibacteraceae bacterium]